MALNAFEFAKANNLQASLTASEVDGGYNFCRELANIATTQHSLTAIYYPSAKQAMEGTFAFCLAILP